MSRYIGPKIRKIKKLGKLPGLKNITLELFKKLKFQKKKITDYGERLIEKQKIRYNYGLSEKQLYNYIKKIKNVKNEINKTNILKIIEMRLDVIVYNLNLAKTIATARQLINHGKIYVNSKRITIASFKCKKNDNILVNFTKNQQNHHSKEKKINFQKKIPNYLKKKSDYKGKIINNQFSTNFNIKENLITEFYSRK